MRKLRFLAAILISYTVYTLIALFIHKVSFLAAPLAGLSGARQTRWLDAFLAPAIAVLAAVTTLVGLYIAAAPIEASILVDKLGILAYMPFILQPLQAGLVGLGSYLIATAVAKKQEEEHKHQETITV